MKVTFPGGRFEGLDELTRGLAFHQGLQRGFVFSPELRRIKLAALGLQKMLHELHHIPRHMLCGNVTEALGGALDFVGVSQRRAQHLIVEGLD
jgi:hypothetical protein